MRNVTKLYTVQTENFFKFDVGKEKNKQIFKTAIDRPNSLPSREGVEN